MTGHGPSGVCAVWWGVWSPLRMQPLLGGGEAEVAFMVFGTKSGVSSERTGYLTYDGSTILASLLQYKFVSYGWFHTREFLYA